MGDAEGGVGTPLGQVLGLLPDAHAAYRDLDAARSNPDGIDAALVALCRMRIGQIVGVGDDSDAVPVDALSREKVDSLRQWPTSPLYTEADRAALNFTEKYVIDASSVDDADCAALRVYFSDPGVTALVIAVAMADAMARFRVALGV